MQAAFRDCNSVGEMEASTLESNPSAGKRLCLQRNMVADRGTAP